MSGTRFEGGIDVERVYLVEGYRPRSLSDGNEDGRFDARWDPAIVGWIAVPGDEELLCLVRAASRDAALAIARAHDLVTIRSVAAQWIGFGIRDHEDGAKQP